jgi:hypothetical protein
VDAGQGGGGGGGEEGEEEDKGCGCLMSSHFSLLVCVVCVICDWLCKGERGL